MSVGYYYPERVKMQCIDLQGTLYETTKECHKQAVGNTLNWAEGRDLKD